MNVYEEVGLNLLANDITYSKGCYTTVPGVKAEGLTGNTLFLTAEDVKERQPYSLMYLGDDKITFNDTEVALPDFNGGKNFHAGILEDEVDTDNWREVHSLLGPDDSVKTEEVWIGTEQGRLYKISPGMFHRTGRGNFLDQITPSRRWSMSHAKFKAEDEDFKQECMRSSKKYHAVALYLADNGVTFTNGAYTTDQELMDLGIIDSVNYKNAHDVEHGRPDTVLNLGNGKITFNDTGLHFPNSESDFPETVDINGFQNATLTPYNKPKEDVNQSGLVSPTEIINQSPENTETEVPESWTKSENTEWGGIDSKIDAIDVLSQVTELEDVVIKYSIGESADVFDRNIITVYDENP